MQPRESYLRNVRQTHEGIIVTHHLNYSDIVLEELDLTKSVRSSASLAISPEPVLAAIINTLPESVDRQAKQASVFAYCSLPLELADKMRAAAARIRSRLRVSIFETGRDLVGVKDSLPYGQFGDWLKLEFGWTERTAQNYMGAAKLVDENANFSVLPPSATYRLAAPGVPSEVLQGVSEDIINGEVPSMRDISSRIAKARRDAAETKRVARAAVDAKAHDGRPMTLDDSKGARDHGDDKAHDDLMNGRAARLAVTFLRAELGTKFLHFQQMHKLCAREFAAAMA